MKADKRPQIERALDRPSPAIRLYLLHGPDESGSYELAERLGKAMGADAQRIDLAAGTLRADPARLADEAAAGSLFGGARHIRIAPASEDCIAAVEALLESSAAGNPVVLVAGALRKDSALLKLALGSERAMAFASYPPDGEQADRLAAALGRERGIALQSDVAHRLADATGGDRAILARELDKLALYLDADPAGQTELSQAALDAVGADLCEGDLGRLIDAVLDGDAAIADAELRQLGETQTVPAIRAILQRLHLLASFAAQTAGGETPHGALASAGKSLFWKDKDAVSRQLGRWRPELLTRAIERMANAERTAKSSAGLGLTALEADLLQTARQAARLR